MYMLKIIILISHRNYNIIDSMKKEMLRNETYMLSVYTSLRRVNLIIPRQRGTKWIIKKTVSLERFVGG